MTSWKHLVRPAIEKLVPFSSARSQTGGGAAVVYLDANENPYAVDTRCYNRYPEPQPHELLSLFADLYGVKPQHIVISLGSEAGIDHIIRVFCEAKEDAMMITPPTFAMYEIWGNVQGVKVLRVPLRRDDLQLDLPAMKAAWTPNCKVIFLCTPNNPMGSLLRREDMLSLCADYRGKSIIVVDEAYQEFTDAPSLIPDLAAHDNLVVLRTLSKAYGLAAARCAAVIGQPEMMVYLRKVMAAYPIPRTSVDIVLESMTPDKRRQRLKDVATLKSERKRLAKALTGHPEIRRIFPSEANFLLLEVASVESFLERLRTGGIIARDRRNDWPNAIRLTIGTPEENDRVLRSLA
jgi:histidinol-phosphate aminotransferase